MKQFTVNRMGDNFEGIAQVEGKVAFVPLAIMGETVMAELVQDNKKYSKYCLKQITVFSEKRQTPPCEYFGICGGCDCQHIDYKTTLQIKTEIVKNALKKVVKKSVNVEPCIQSKPYFYRNKAVFNVNTNGDLCFFKQNSHYGVAVNYCYLMEKGINEFISVFSDFLKKNNIQGYNWQTKCGEIKHVEMRYVNDNFLFVIFSVKTTIQNIDELVSMISAKTKNFGLYFCIIQNESYSYSANIQHICGNKDIAFEELGIKTFVQPFSFMQVNNDIAKLIYKHINNNINGGVVIDAYGGRAVLSALVSKNASKVICIEVERQSCQDGKKIIKENNIMNVEIINDKCENTLFQICKQNHVNTVILDPPQKGCEKSILQTLNNSNAKKILYLSCNPQTLARDLCQLYNFEICKVQPYDMFPQTKNIETLVVLNKI